MTFIPVMIPFLRPLAIACVAMAGVHAADSATGSAVGGTASGVLGTGLPVWCQDIPAYRALEGAGSFAFKDIAQLPDAVDWLEQQPAFRQQRRCRRLFDPIILYSRYYDSFINSIPIRK